MHAAELAAAAQAVAPFLAAEQRRRSSGGDVRVRTIAYCGASGTVSYSMLGAPPTRAVLLRHLFVI